MTISEDWLIALSILSLALLLVGALLVPLVVARLPADFFSRRETPRATRSRFARLALQAARNVGATVVIAAGVAMLVLPGQGLLTIVAGLLLADFRWKHRLLRRLVGVEGVQRSLNFLRRRLRKPAFVFEQREP